MSLVFGNIEKMYARNDAGKIKLEIFPPKARYYGILELRKQDGYYSIVSFFTRKKEHEKPKGKLIWVRNPQSATSQATNDQSTLNDSSGKMLQEYQTELTAQTTDNINPLQREIKLVSEKNPQKTDKNGPSAAPDGAMEGKRTETDRSDKSDYSDKSDGNGVCFTLNGKVFFCVHGAFLLALASLAALAAQVTYAST